jgi:hypothetical protein
MFVETITAPRDEWEHFTERLRVVSDPPPALVASVAWLGPDGLVTALNVWDTPEAVADFYVERVGAIVQAEGEPANKPQRHGEPLAVYIRR